MTVAARSHSKDEPSQPVSARAPRSEPKRGRRILRLRNVNLRNQHDHLVLNSVSASFVRGTISAILTGYRDLPWPPAQEPSPFLLACAGLTPVESGRIIWPRPRSLAARFRGDLEPIGYVPRRCALNDELTVEQELMLALAATGRFADQNTMLALCRVLVLTPLLKAQVALLTPFERLRTAIARALVTGTPLLLVEEPTEFLSSEESEYLFGHLNELAQMGYSIIIATRSPEVAAQSDQALILIDGEVVGNISQPDYHALNLAFSTALKNPQSGPAMSWVSPPGDSIVTIDDDELIDLEDDEDSDEDAPSLHPTWVPVVPTTARERQLRPIPLALPPVATSTPSGGVPTEGAAKDTGRQNASLSASSASRSTSSSSVSSPTVSSPAPRPSESPASVAPTASGISAGEAVDSSPTGRSTAVSSTAAGSTSARPSARLFPPVSEVYAHPISADDSVAHAPEELVQAQPSRHFAEEPAGQDISFTGHSPADTMRAAAEEASSVSLPEEAAVTPPSSPKEAAATQPATALPQPSTALPNVEKTESASEPDTASPGAPSSAHRGSNGEHFYPSTTMLPQIPRPTTGPLSEDSTEVLNRAQQILTELPGPVLPLVNKNAQGTGSDTSTT